MCNKCDNTVECVGSRLCCFALTLYHDISLCFPDFKVQVIVGKVSMLMLM